MEGVRMGYEQRPISMTRGVLDAAGARKVPNETWDTFLLRLMLAARADGLRRVRETTDVDALREALDGDTSHSSRTTVSVRMRTRQIVNALRTSTQEVFVLRLLEVVGDESLNDLRVETLHLEYEDLLERVLEEFEEASREVNMGSEDSVPTSNSNSKTSESDIATDGGQQ